MEPLYSTKLNTNQQYYSNIPGHSQTLPMGSSMRPNPQYMNAQYANMYPEEVSQYSNLPQSGMPSTLPRMSPAVSNQNVPVNLHSGLRGSNQSLNSKLVGPKAYSKPEQHVTYSNIQVGAPKPPHDTVLYTNLQLCPGNVYSNLQSRIVYANGKVKNVAILGAQT